MKVIHVPFCFWPNPVGGTEVYVESLAKQQLRQGLDVMIAAPAQEEDGYSHDGLRVRRYPVGREVQDVRDLYGEGDLTAARVFGRILEEERPDLVHLHAFTRGVSLRLVREAKRHDLPVVFSYHTPTVSCQRGTLLRWGSEVCDGVVDLTKCARCALHGHGLNKVGSLLAGSIPSGVGRVLGIVRASGGVWTAARMTELVRVRQNAFRSLMAEVDHIVALCEWVKEVLLRNDVPDGKITVSLQGLDPSPDIDSSSSINCDRGHRKSPIRIAFLGRLDPTKGVHVLIQALKSNPALDVRLDIFGVVQEGGESYLRHLTTLATGDARVNLRPAVPSSDVIPRLKYYDLLAVPSQCLETGPRVVLEAFAAGMPVIGSNLGGVAELVQHGVNGLLVEPRSIEGWSRAFQAFCEDADLLPGLRSGIRPPRSVRAVADQMRDLYTAVLHSRSHAASVMASA